MRRLIHNNPFLTSALVGALFVGVWLALLVHDSEGAAAQAVYYIWRVLLAPVHLAANLLAPLTDRWPDALDAAAAVVVGLLPYIGADFAWRSIRARRALQQGR